VAWWSYPPLDRSPRVPQTRHRRRRRRRDAVFYRLYYDFTAKHVSRFVRREKNLLFSPDHSFFSLSISLSLSERKDALSVVSRKKHVGRSVGRSRKKVALLEERGLCGCVYKKRVLYKSLKERIGSLFVSLRKSFSFPPCPPPPFKKNT
jgi:hypothetical protein